MAVVQPQDRRWPPGVLQPQYFRSVRPAPHTAHQGALFPFVHKDPTVDCEADATQLVL